MKKRILCGCACVLVVCALGFGGRVSAAEELVGPIYPLPRVASFHSLAHTNWPWQPAAPHLFTNAVYAIVGWTNHYVYNDLDDPGHTGGLDRSQMMSSEEQGGYETFGYEQYTTNLFIMTGATNTNQIWLALSNTVAPPMYYQIGSRTNLVASPAAWDASFPVLQDTNGIHQIPFGNVGTGGPSNRFFMGFGSRHFASARLDPDYNLAVKPATGGGSAQNGKFLISLGTNVGSAVTLYYRLSGSGADNGRDFASIADSNSIGSVTIAAGSYSTQVVVQPFYTNLSRLDQSVSLTLMLSKTGGFLVDPEHATATMKMYNPRPQEMAVAILDSGWTKYWWTNTAWAYFTLPEAVKEALRCDGTPFAVFSDLDIANGALMTTNGLPKYPILISLGNEVIRDDEITPLTSYVAAGGFIFAGSSAFTRATNGSYRSNFAFSNEFGISCVPSSTNWMGNQYLAPETSHRLVNHIPLPWVTWRMPESAEETSWGTCQSRAYDAPHPIWKVSAPTAQVLATGDDSTGSPPYLTYKAYGQGYFIYDAALQPLIAHGGNGPGMYAYLIFRRAIEWAFESAQRPIVRLSPWPYQYNAPFMVRHDLENYYTEVEHVNESAQFEHDRGAKGDYYFCTGAITNTGVDFAGIVAGLRNAVASNGATIGPHNGGLPNPFRTTDTNFSGCNLDPGDYQYFHWGPDEPLNLPGGYAYASNSLAISFTQVETWITNQPAGFRVWVVPYFNGTRERSYAIQESLGVKVTGEQKIGPFPHWNLSTRTDGKRHSFLSEPVSDWYVGPQVAQVVGPWQGSGDGNGKHTSQTLHAAVDSFYANGFLINFYSHSLTYVSTGDQGGAHDLMADYVEYCANKANIWAANARDIYDWWLKRSGASISASYYATNGAQTVASMTISGAQDAATAVEVFVGSYGFPGGLSVETNGVAASSGGYRIAGQNVKVRVGTAVTNVQVRYTLQPKAQDDEYPAVQATIFHLPNPGVLANDWAGPTWPNLQAVNASTPQHGTVTLTNQGGFTYTPNSNFFGTDCFAYELTDGQSYGSARVEIVVSPGTNAPFVDDFERCPGTGIEPWQIHADAWRITDGVLLGSNSTFYANSYLPQVWTNFALEAEVAFANGSYGGGLGGRLGSSGEHYAAWLYPGTFTGGSNILKLVKFIDWTHWGTGGNDNQVALAEGTVPPIGTAWHSLKLICSNATLQVIYENSPVITYVDSSSAFTNGGVSIDAYGGTINVSNLVVTPLPIP